MTSLKTSDKLLALRGDRIARLVESLGEIVDAAKEARDYPAADPEMARRQRKLSMAIAKAEYTLSNS